MSEGLAPERVARWLAGERSPEDERHAATCEKCGEELERMETALSGFRGAVRGWAAQQSGAACPDTLRFERARHARVVRRVRWTLVTAALAMLVAVPSWKDARDRQREAEADRADAALLERVSYQLSQTTPAPLAPLHQMFASGFSGADANATDLTQ